MLLRILTGFCTVFAFTFCANANEPNANELIAMYERSLSVLDKSTYEIETQMAIEGIQDYEGPKSIIRKSIVYRDGDRWAVIAEDQFIFEDSQRPTEIFYYNQIIDKRSITYRSDGNKPVRAVYVDSDLKTGKAKARAAWGGGIISEGYILGNDPLWLPDILRSSLTLEVRNEKPEIDGYPTYVLESRGENGKIILWLDPNSGFHPRRIEEQKSGEDLLNGQPVSSIRSEGNIVSNKQLEKYSLVIDSVKIEQIDAVFVMTGANITETRTYSDGHEIRASYDFKRSKVDLNPDFNALKAFKIKVPDGTPVYDQDFPAGRFRILGNKMVPAEDPTFEEIDKMVDEIKKQEK